MEWDLSSLYTSLSDPKIKEDMDELLSLSKTYTKTYKGTISTHELTASHLLEVITTLESFFERVSRLGSYASLLHAKQSTDEKIGAFYASFIDFSSTIDTELIWFSLEIKDIPNETLSRIITDPSLSLYAHWITSVRVFRPHMLSQGEEILDEKRSHAILSFRRLYDETLAKTRIPFTLEGKKQDFSLSSFSPILSQHPDRKVREKATKAYTKAITENSSLYQLILNTLLYNTSLTNEIRSYSYPQESTFLSYEITPKIIEALSSAISSHYEICQRFYRAKAKILHLSTLYEWDRYSTIYPEAKHADISFSDAKSLVLSSFSSFSETFHNIASGFFEGNYIDSILKDGKQSGAFCSYITPHLHPYILTNYANRLEDVTTLAHELGHGIHGVLASGNPYFEFYPSTAIAEIASIFGESLVFDRLYSHESDPKQKINLLATKLQNSFATVFRQHAFYLFELDIQNSRKENGEISLQDFSRFYLSRLQAMFGDSLILTPEHGSWWMTVGHFFRYNFYVITYCMGELFSLLLYEKYKTEGQPFVSRYIKALSKGGSQSPQDIAKLLEIDLTDPTVWEAGLSYLSSLVSEFEELTKSA